MKNTKDRKPFKCQLFACNCEGTIPIDAKKLGKDLGLAETPEVYNDLCRSQLTDFQQSISQGPDQSTVVACTHEAPLFEELANDAGTTDISFANIREQAGWSASGAKAGAKISALIAESLYESTPTGLLPLTSNGECVIYGGGQEALEVAQKLSDRLSVTLILTDTDGIILPSSTFFPIMKGTITQFSGALGDFKLTIDGYAALRPSARSQLKFQSSQNAVEIKTDLVFDLSGKNPLINSTNGRDGYVRVEPDNRAKISEAMYDIAGLVGEFEKPIFVSYDQNQCAHSRNGITGCSNCIDNCPSSAISSDGDGVFVYHKICDGCGHCASSCPSGAIAYVFPHRSDIIGRCQTLISTYLSAGGANPVLLLHEDNHGGEIIAAMARFGDGLAANVLPFGVHSITHLGHEALCAFFTTGVQTMFVLAPKKKRDELDNLNFQIELTNRFSRTMEFDPGIHVELINEDDPDAVAAALSEIGEVAGTKLPAPKNFVASKNKRETARLALANLNAMSPVALDVLDLPDGAPYGQIFINKESCTLCLSCVGACPANALSDNEARPQVSFIEAACLQCGLCQTTCPENAISLNARYNFGSGAISPVILNFEDPLDCIRCGKPFGSKSAIEKVIATLQGKNPMFQTSEQLDLLKMCENCRVAKMAESEKDPMTLGVVPKTLTAADITPEDDEPTLH